MWLGEIYWPIQKRAAAAVGDTTDQDNFRQLTTLTRQMCDTYDDSTMLHPWILDLTDCQYAHNHP